MADIAIVLRRLPIVFSIHKLIHQIDEKRQAIFVGFFGPIGVSAIFYLYITIKFLETITVDGVIREDAQRLIDTVTVVVWFLSICSIVSQMARWIWRETNVIGCPRSEHSPRKTRLFSPSHNITHVRKLFYCRWRTSSISHWWFHSKSFECASWASPGCRDFGVKFWSQFGPNKSRSRTVCRYRSPHLSYWRKYPSLGRFATAFFSCCNTSKSHNSFSSRRQRPSNCCKDTGWVDGMGI